VIRITTQSKQNQTVVTIDGRATESDLKEIQRVRKAVKGEVVLSLRGLDACETAGIRLLRAWLDAGARLQDATPFLEMVLNEPLA
jgi:hypothetical protein